MAATAFKWGRLLAKPAAIVFGTGTFLAILGPFGSYALGWLGAWLYWTGFIALGTAIGYGAGHLLPRLFPDLPKAAAYCAVAALVSVPVTGAVLAMNTAVFSQTVDLERVMTVYALVLVISAFATAVVYVVERLSTPETAETASTRPAAALIDKLPARLKTAQIQALAAEDHYLRVHTDRGEALILMRLSDAAAACEGLDGARTHRSWWVARAAVRDAVKADGRATLTLEDGVRAPVSRTYYPRLREAGWF